MKHFNSTLWLLVAGLAAGCSSGSSSGGKSPSGLVPLDKEVPEDSTGQQGTVALSVQSSAPVLALEDAPATEKKVGDVTLTYAKFNIAKIKIKPKKENSSKETELDEQEKDREKLSAQKLNDDVEKSEPAGDDDTNLSPGERPERPERPSFKKLASSNENLKSTVRQAKEREGKELEDEAKADPSTAWSGPYVFNAITGAVENGPLTAKIPDGSYRRIQFQLKRYLNENADPSTEPLLGNVFALAGSVKVGAETYTLKINWHVAFNVRISGDSAFAVSPGEDNVLTISLNRDKWFEGIDWSKATVDAASKTITVDSENNREIMKTIHKNLKKCARAGKDGNKDGKLQESEAISSGEETNDATSEATSEAGAE